MFTPVFAIIVNASAVGSASPDSFNLSDMLRHEIKSNESRVTVSSGTWPGNYTVNIAAAWNEVNGWTNGTNTTSILVMVQANPAIEIIEANLSYYILGGNTKNNTMNLYSVGNANATDITYSCTWGEVCDNFTVVFDPVNVSVLEPGQGQPVNVNITVPGFYEAGEYAGIITASESSGSNDSVFVVVTVPINLSWGHNPTGITVNLSHDTIGFLQYIIVENTGNTAVLELDTPHNDGDTRTRE